MNYKVCAQDCNGSWDTKNWLQKIPTRIITVVVPQEQLYSVYIRIDNAQVGRVRYCYDFQDGCTNC